MVFLKSAGVLLLLASLFAAVLIAVKDMPNPESIITCGSEEPLALAKGVGLYSIGMMQTTGAWQGEWLPPKDKTTYLLEDMPHPDSTLLILPILLSFGLLAIWKPTTPKGKWALALAIISIIIIFYIVQLFLAKEMLYKGGEIIQETCSEMTKEEVTANRQKQIDLIEKANILWLSLFLFIVGVATWIQVLGRKK